MTNLPQCKTFLSTLSVRRATEDAAALTDAQHISIHALREESDERPKVFHIIQKISIHALREESDLQAKCICPSWKNFYPRSP